MLQIKHILGVILVLNILFIAIVYDASQRVTTDAFLNQTHETTQKEASKQAFAMRPELVEEIQKYMYTEPQIISDQGDEDGKIALVSVPLEETALITNPFELLGAYPTIAKKYFNTYPDKKIMYNFTDHGLYNDDDYCERADSYNLEHPENMFEQMNFFTDYGAAEAMTRDLVIKEIGNDTMPHISIYMKSKEFNSRKYHLPLNITNYFTKRVDLHLYHQLGKHFLCATQMYNHIPGHGVIKRKDLVVGTVEKYATTFKKRPQCFKKNEFFPLSYRLYQKDECNKFFKILNSKKYQDSLATEPIQYLLKVGVGAHKAAGVSLVDKAKTEFLMNKYKNGTKCGKNLESYVAQSYVSNPLLLDRNNKFDFRIYMLVASTNPLIVYYHDGLIRVSLTPYDKFSNDRGTHLTNTALSLKKFLKESKSNDTNATSDTNETTISGMNEEQAKKYMLWRFEELESYLIESGKVQDEKWLDNYLRPAFKKAFIHVSRMASASLWKQSNVYELFGLDFMLDDKMNLWLIECNSSPQLPESNGREFMVKMMKDVFEIEYAYYRSRMKRILNVIKNMQEAQAELESIDLEEWRNKYQEAAKNRIEPEYSISKDSSFTLILDENLPGDEAYFGHLPKGCA